MSKPSKNVLVPRGAPRTDDAPWSVLRADGTALPGRDPKLAPELMLRMYRAMTLIRALDGRMLILQRQGRIGFWGPTRGQEGATIASCAAFEDRDWILPALREGGCALYRGFSLTELVAQTIGNALDRVKGRQMPCHYSFKEGNYVAMSSVIGTQIPHAVGVALGAKTRGDDVVAAGYMGDGATSSSDFHVAMNFGAVSKAPVVFICQNNQWAISVPIEKQTVSSTIAVKAVAYGMEGVRVDGNDVLAVYSATKRAVDKARAGGGPTFLELLTFRVLGHSSSDDPTRYRDESCVKEWEAKDPIVRFRRYLESRKLWNQALEDELDGQHQAAISQAIKAAEAAPAVPTATIVDDVYATVPAHLKEQLRRTLDDLGG
ncbi:MAG: 3-methyl-2-oxobutanoate dehydrogenase [Planctomycetes bacterium]|nr:3-methyl-2-oxobutanoate dehydrogenase [Planctomycetota bacterium]MCC7172493.1 3-methyl-2-oxobutanoate dehydrogenase [Planctomycetota bacterium]